MGVGSCVPDLGCGIGGGGGGVIVFGMADTSGFFTMRKICILLFFLLTSPSNAATIETMYKHCKPYAGNGFQIPSGKGLESSLCAGYFSSVRDQAGMNCVTFARLEKTSAITIPDQVKEFYSGFIPSTNALIQEFLNLAEENPGVWDEHVPLLNVRIISQYDCP